jgi:uncharacterized protein (TIGR01777 family)
MSAPQKVAITGASGWVGRALVPALKAEGRTVVTIGRGPGNDVPWDPTRGIIDRAALAGVEAVVHLAGANIGERWTPAYKQELRDSRVLSTRLIAETMAALSPRPAVLVSTSATGIYGDRGDEVLSETSSLGDDFLGRLAQEWEAAAEPARAAGIRVVHPRFGVILGPKGGALAKMLPAFRLMVGGPLGSGRQWMSWVALADVVRAVQFALDTPTLSGAVNVVSPEPTTNAAFAHALGEELHVPAILPTPAFALKLLFGEMAQGTILNSQRVRPDRLLAAGFRFDYPTLAGALAVAVAR